MAQQALPCLVCGKELRNVMAEVENQPNDGVACQTSGNYGSTVFDSLNGEFLEFNLCDPCLVKAGAQGRINAGRSRRPVVAGQWNALIGWERVAYRPVTWHEGLSGFGSDDVCRLNEDELDSLPETVQLNQSVEFVRALFADYLRKD